MKAFKRAFALVLTLAIVMSLGITAFADGAATTYTIEITNPARSGVSMKDQTFTAYKIFDAVYDKPDNPKASVTYTVTKEFAKFSMDTPTDMKKDFGATITGDEIPEYVGKLKNDSEELYKFGKAALKFAKQDGKILAKDITAVTAATSPIYTVNAQGDEIVKISVKEPGYYLIDCKALANTTFINSLALTTARPNAKLVLKMGKPTLDKNLVAGGQETEKDDVFTTEIGKELTFNLDTIVPNMAGYEKFFYEFKDELGTGLTPDLNSVKIQVFGRDSSGKATGDPKTTFILDTDYTKVTTTPNSKYVITLTFNDLKAVLASSNHVAKGVETGDIMRVTYKAKLNGDALDRNMVNNVAELTYSNDPSNVDREQIPGPDGTFTDGTNTTPQDEVKLYTADLDIFKYGVEDNPLYGTPGHEDAPEFVDKALAGAKFVLYKKVTVAVPSGKPATKVVNYYYNYNYETNEVVWTAFDSAAEALKDKKVLEVESSGTGKLKNKFVGLEAGTYFLEETKAPNGYTKLKTPYQINITPKYSTTNTAAEELVGYEFSYGLEGTTPVIVNTTFGSNTVRIALEAKVLNTNGELLPETGGIGTTIFYTVGVILMVSALVLLITKKKMSVN